MLPLPEMGAPSSLTHVICEKADQPLVSELKSPLTNKFWAEITPDINKSIINEVVLMIAPLFIS